MLALLPRTLKVASLKFGGGSGCPVDDFRGYSQYANSQRYNDDSDGEDDDDDDDDDSDNESC